MQQQFVKVKFLKAFAEGSTGWREGERDTLEPGRAQELARAGIVELLEDPTEEDPAAETQTTATRRQPETAARRRSG